MAKERYVLATGEEGAYRLRIVNSVHGADTETFLRRAGIAPGMLVADIGCGIGTISCWLAEQVGPTGKVAGVDISPGQVEQAQKAAQSAGFSHAHFTQAGAYETGLESEAFDLVFCRFVLMHVQHIDTALQEMKRVLKPGGVLAVEDGDFSTPFCDPPNVAFARCIELYRAIGEQHNEDFLLGRKLYRLVRAAGFREVEAALVQPLFTRGEAKRLPEWTLAVLVLSAYQSAHASLVKLWPLTLTTGLMAKLYFLAKEKSRSSCAGTPITAPSP